MFSIPLAKPEFKTAQAQQRPSIDANFAQHHANGNTLDDTIAEAKRYKDMGYLAIRLQSGVPGLASTYGVSKDKLYYEPADAAKPTENVWSTIKYLPTVPKLKWSSVLTAATADVSVIPYPSST